MNEDTTVTTPMQELMRTLAVDSEVQVLIRVREMVEQLATLMSLTVIPVVMAGGQPLFVQLPPTQSPHTYAPELIELVREALVDASASLRMPLARSRRAAKETAAKEIQETATSGS